MPGYDPFGSMQAMIGQFQQFRANPMQFLMRNTWNLPNNINPVQDPQAAIQYLMNNGQMNQQQYNALQKLSQQV